jgi:SNF2 family DNA or RNA helicase
MPETVTLKRKVELTPTQIGMLAELKKEWVFDVGEVAITAQNAAIRLGKLMQVCQGIAIDSDSEVHAVDALPRLQAMYDAVLESESKSIVFVPYVGALKQVSAYLTSRGITNEIVYGGVSGSKRTQVFNDFQTRKSPQVIVAHPRTTSHGLTLTAASTTVWYGPIFSAETFEQANNRTDRPGQKFNMRNIHLYATPEEKKVFDALESKISLQGVLLDMYRRIAPQ